MNPNGNFAARPKVAFFFQDSSLGIYFLESLLSNYLQITIHAKNITGWETKIKHLSHNRFFGLRERKFVKSDSFSYFVLDFNEVKHFSLDDLEILYGSALVSQAKILLIAPFVFTSGDEKSAFKRINNFFENYELFKIVYVGEIFVYVFPQDFLGKL